jgi:hypothetical protein
MKLGIVLLSRDAWSNLGALSLPPHTAYKLMKYCKKIDEELVLIDKHKNQLIRTVTETPEGPARIAPDSPEETRFITEYNEFLGTESELAQFDFSFDQLLELISKNSKNALSVQDLAKLEPFFKQ